MDNINTALMIAGGLLIAILIIGALVYMFSILATVPQEQQTVKRIEQITEFNKTYEAYEKKKVRGTEVVTLVNRARDNNSKYQDNANMQIRVSVTITKAHRGYGTVQTDTAVADDGLTVGTYDFTATGNAAVEKILTDRKNEGHAFMYARFFQCTQIEYNNETGRVCAINFTETN